MDLIPQQATWVRFPRFVGDAAMQMSVLRLLRMLNVGPLVVWGPRATVEILKGSDLCDYLVAEDRKPSAWMMAKTLRQFQPARSIHFTKSMRPAFAAWLADVPERIGVSESLAGFFNTISQPFWSATGPFLLRYHRVLRERWPESPEMPFADFKPHIKIARPTEPYIVLMPGSTWTSKMWPAEAYRQLLLLFRSEGFQVALLGSPEEIDLCRTIAQEDGINLAGQTTLQEAAAWLHGARLAIGNDSGLSHLAAATGTKTLTFYGATDPKGSLPWGPHSHELHKSGSSVLLVSNQRVFVKGHPCMTKLTAMDVWITAKSLAGSVS